MPKWSVVPSDGRGGTITYHEGPLALVFDWEFLVGRSVAAVWLRGRGDWDARAGWARGRRDEILPRVAAEVIRQKAPGCVARFDPGKPCEFVIEKTEI